MKFIVLGDLHYTNYTLSDDCTGRDYFFDVLFQAVAAQKADRVFAIGDIVHEGEHSEIQGLFEIARRHGVELICTTGNHDTAALPKTVLRPYFVDGQAQGNELYHAFSQDNTRFVLLDTGREMLCDVDWSGYVGAEQQDWLREEIRAFKASSHNDKNLVVMGHHPIYGTTYDSARFRLNIENSGEVQEILGQVKPGRAIYVCGHNHVNSIAGADKAGWTYVQCGAPLVAFSFRLITADESGLKVETVDFGLNDPVISRHMPGLRAGLLHFSDLSLEVAAGQPSDRNWQIKQFAKI